MNDTDTLAGRITFLKRAKPFQAFAVRLRNGSRRLIEDPDGLVVTDAWVHYAVPGSDRVIHLGIAEIEAVDLVPVDLLEHRMLETILMLKHREPFVQFQILMNSGDRYLIENPDLLAIGKSELAYYFPKSNRVAFLRSNQIAAVEQLEEKPAA